jgi:hypothetical protein
VATIWGETDPVAAATLVLNALPPGKEQDDAVVGIVQRWAQSAPEQVSVWVAEFPEGPLREVALENVAKLWSDQNQQETALWLKSLASGPSRDAAISAYVTRIAPSSPDVAVGWMASIEDDSMRLRQMEALAENWLSSDKARATEWITQALMPASVKTRLLSPKEP